MGDVMTEQENKTLVDLALLWRSQACQDIHCGDYDCMTLRDCANSLISELNFLRLPVPSCAVVGCRHIGIHTHDIDGPAEARRVVDTPFRLGFSAPYVPKPEGGQ